MSTWKTKMKAAAAAGNPQARKASQGLQRTTSIDAEVARQVGIHRRLDAIEAGTKRAISSRGGSSSGAWFAELVEAAENWDREALALLRKRSAAGDARSISTLRAMNEPLSDLVANSEQRRLSMGYRVKGRAPMLTPAAARARVRAS